VALGERSYDILIGAGLLAEAENLLAPHFRRRKTAIVTDGNVARHHLPALEEALRTRGFEVTSIVLAPGEATKSFASLSELCHRLLAAGIERQDRIIAFGGGVIGDLAGFAAAILRRGIDFVQVPTTLLAQVDSSVGGKTGINSPLGKNLIGAFHQPLVVIADTDLLATLPARELAAGYAEVAKYGLLGDARFFAWLEANLSGILAGKADALTRAITVSCTAKAEIVARDERESGPRALLNLGHTFAHALEAATGYGERLLHGEAVAIGMVEAFRFSARLGLCDAALAERVAAHLTAAGLPVSLSAIAGELPDAAGLLAVMRQDKKAEGGRLAFVLVRGIGQAFVARDVDETQVLAFLEDELRRR
jgi:3-dehydroquinate synthase